MKKGCPTYWDCMDPKVTCTCNDQQPETVTITEPVEWTDRSLPTACNWIRYEIQPGEYEVSLRNDYWRVLRVQARRLEEHYVNRLFTATKLSEQSSAVGQVETITVPIWAVEKEAQHNA